MNTTAGIVLAGGKSTRMGQDKAMLEYLGVPLLDHMIKVLKSSGFEDVYVSGDYDGYACFPDEQNSASPAAAIADILGKLKNYDGIVVVPVDMPLLSPDLILELLEWPQGAFYIDKHFPAFIPQQETNENCKNAAMMHLYETMGLKALPIPQHANRAFKNVNTPEDWREVTTGKTEAKITDSP